MVASLEATLPASVPYEVILVDDGSTDGTREWLAGLGEPYRVVLNERNLGFGRATNRGAELARGSVLALLNNDLVLQPGWFRPMLRALYSLGPRAGVVGNVQLNAATGKVDHAGIYFNRKCKPEHDRRDPGAWSLAFNPVRRVAAATGACLLVRADTWRDAGGFDPAYVNGCEDVDLCLRLAESGRVNAVALRSRVLHHVSASPGRKIRDEENTRRLVRRWHERIAVLGGRRWAWRHYSKFFSSDPRDVAYPVEAWKVAFYLAGIRAVPPVAAVAALEDVMDRELAHWRTLLSD